MLVSMIVSDWEGCIASPRGSRDPWPLEDMLALREVISELTIPFVICTGRPVPYVEAGVQALALHSQFPSIAENGAVLLYSRPRRIVMNPVVTLDVANTMQEVRALVERIASEQGTTRSWGKEICVSISKPDDVSIKEFASRVAERLERFSQQIEITHSKSSVDITPSGINKGSGLRFLSRLAKIPLEEILCIGDAQGDMSMLSIAGIAACPANGDESLTPIVAYRSPFPTTKGVIDIISRFV